MTLDELEYLLTGEMLFVKIKADGEDVTIEPELSFFLNEKSGEGSLKVNSIILNRGGERTELNNFNAVRETLEGCNLELVSINGEYESLDEYERKKAFDNISMEELLKLVLPVADSFSLTCPYNDGYGTDNPYGLYRIDEGLADKAVNEISEWQYRTSESQFGQIPEDDRKRLPPFDKLYRDVESECRSFRKKHGRDAEKYFGNVFFADRFMRGKTKYKKPPELWHIYHAVDFVETCRFSLGKMKGNKEVRPLDCELDKEEYRELKSSLKKIDVSFNWHCTTSGSLSKTFYFELNDKTVNWLKKHRDDYDFNLLEDLAFYSGDKVRFSSCTHEHFHSRILK